MFVASGELKPHPKNPRRGNLHAIKQSIQENGFYGSLLVQRSTGYILAGYHRYLAGGELGMLEFPVLYVDCDDETALRILLADNRTSDIAGYSENELLELLEQLQQSYGDAELQGTGYDPDDVAKLVKQLRGDAMPPGDEKLSSPGGMARVGEYLFPIDRDAYFAWVEDLRDAAGFNRKKIVAEILRRLELDPA